MGITHGHILYNRIFGYLMTYLSPSCCARLVLIGGPSGGLLGLLTNLTHTPVAEATAPPRTQAERSPRLNQFVACLLMMVNDGFEHG